MLQEVLSIIFRFAFAALIILMLGLSLALLLWVVWFAWNMEFLNVIRRRWWKRREMVRDFLDVAVVVGHRGQLLGRVVNMLSMI